MSHSEARFLARMLFGRTRTLSDEQRIEQSERARKTITKEELWRGRIGRLEDKIHSALSAWQNLSSTWWQAVLLYSLKVLSAGCFARRWRVQAGGAAYLAR
jgi:hypothetical protein